MTSRIWCCAQGKAGESILDSYKLIKLLLNGAVQSGRKGWGGKRQGAGRKLSPNIRVSLVLPRQVWKALQGLAEQVGQEPETLAVQWLEEKMTEKP